MLKYVVSIVVIIVSVYFIIPTYLMKLIYKINRTKKGKEIYLTFDDGPSIYTNKLLDILKKYNVAATFFCVGENAEKYKEIIKREVEENHLIGIHSHKHTNACLMGIKRTKNDFDKSLEIMDKLNIKIKYYRPPWGHLTLLSIMNIRRNNLKLILWNVMAEDWKEDTTSEIIEEKLLKRTNGNDIICLHDGRGKDNAPIKTIKALDKAIPKLIEKGYVFKTIDKYYEK